MSVRTTARICITECGVLFPFRCCYSAWSFSYPHTRRQTSRVYNQLARPKARLRPLVNSRVRGARRSGNRVNTRQSPRATVVTAIFFLVCVPCAVCERVRVRACLNGISTRTLRCFCVCMCVCLWWRSWRWPENTRLARGTCPAHFSAYAACFPCGEGCSACAVRLTRGIPGMCVRLCIYILHACMHTRYA